MAILRQLTRRVVASAPQPLTVSAIIDGVLALKPETPKSYIYSAVYKMNKAGRIIKHPDSTYTLNRNYKRGGGGKAA